MWCADSRPRIVDDVDALAGPTLQADRLAWRQTQLAGGVVDAAGQEVRGQRGDVLDGPDDDALELRLLAPPGRVGLEHDMRAGLDLGHAIGAEPQPGVGRVGFVGASVAVLVGQGAVLAVERSEERLCGKECCPFVYDKGVAVYLKK